MSGWNFPPGTTNAHIDASTSEICLAYSPDGQYQCDRNMDHKDDHQLHGFGAVWGTRDDWEPMESVLILASWPQHPADFDEYGEPVKPPDRYDHDGSNLDPRRCDCGKGEYCPLMTKEWKRYLGVPA